jgi:hypothetical protein
MSGVTRVSEHTYEIGSMGAAVPQEPPPAPASVPLPASQPVKPAARQATAVQPLDLRTQLAQLRARLRDVQRELKNKKALEFERDQLQRLIKAATTEIDNVRRLRAAG